MNDPRPTDGERRGPRTASAERPRPARQGFDKERATLLLLTVTLGLGVGAAARFLQRADQSRTTASGSPPGGLARAQTNSGVPFQNQRVVVLPQRSFIGRATSRMS